MSLNKEAICLCLRDNIVKGDFQQSAFETKRGDSFKVFVRALLTIKPTLDQLHSMALNAIAHFTL